MDAVLTYGKSLREFENVTGTPVFQNADQYPEFFHKHLVHPQRKIKVFLNDPNANIRAFYFQYLVLCYEIQNPSYEFYVNKLHKLLGDPNFTFLFLENDDETIFNDYQFKRLMVEFLDILDSGELGSIQNSINKYPIIDLVFVYFFRSLIIYAGITEDFDSYIDKNILFGFFMESFKIDVAIFQEKCLKFFQAEIFLYEESPQEMYLVYKQLQNEGQSQQNSQSPYEYEINSSPKQSFHQNISMLSDYEISSEKNPSSKNAKKTFEEIPHRSSNPLPNNQAQKISNISHHKKQKHSNIYESTNQQQVKFPVSDFNASKTKQVKNYQYHNQYIEQQYQPRSMRNSEDIMKQYNDIIREGRTTRATTITGREEMYPLLNNQGSEQFQQKQLHRLSDENKNSLYNPNSYLQSSNTIIPASQLQQQKVNQQYRQSQGFKDKQTYSTQAGSTRKATMKEHPFSKDIMQKLEVSKQFTDSLTLAKMGQPYQSHIKAMKQRSRQFRQSLLISFN